MSTLPSLRSFSLAAVLASLSLVLTLGNALAAPEERTRPTVEQLQAQIDALQKQLDAISTETRDEKKKSKAVQVYGQVRVSIDNRSGDWVSGDGTEIVSNASRVGVKGEMDTALENTTLFYLAEVRYETTDEVTGDAGGKDLEFREGFAGLRGTWGAVRAGRLSNGYKSTGTTIDPWVDNAPQARQGGRQGMSELHAAYFNNTIEYFTPKFGGGFTANAWYSTRFDDSSKAIHNGGALTNFRGGQASGLGLKYSGKRLFVGADWLDIDADTITGGGVSNDSAWQIAGRYNVLENFSVAALYEDAEDIGLGNNTYVNGIYTIDKIQYIVAYGRNRDRVANGNKDWNNWSVGLKYALTKSSELLSAFNNFTDDTADLDFRTITVGINARF